MTRTLVVGAAPIAGSEAFYRDLLASAEHVVAADAAGEWCVSLGRLPDVVVGDFDSSETGAADRLRALGAQIAEWPHDKDATDLDLAVDTAVSRWGAPVAVTAAFSLRLDHTLAALGTLMRAGPEARVIEPYWSALAIEPGAGIVVGLESGQPFSLLAVGETTGVVVTGARWGLDGAALPAFSGRGVSNIADGPVTIACATGVLLVIIGDGTPAV